LRNPLEGVYLDTATDDGPLTRRNAGFIRQGSGSPERLPDKSGVPVAVSRSPTGGASVPKVLELQGDREIVRAHGSDDRLQLIAALAGNANFGALDLAGDFQLSFADKAGDLLGDLRFEALLDFDELPSMAERGNVRLAALDIFQADIAFGQLAHDDFR